MCKLRPRLTKEEISFLTRTLQVYAQFLEAKEQEIEQREGKISRLHNEVCVTCNLQTLEELKRERQQLQIDEQQDYSGQAWATNVLLKRFQGLSSGRKLHSARLTRYLLKEIKMEPKTP